MICNRLRDRRLGLLGNPRPLAFFCCQLSQPSLFALQLDHLFECAEVRGGINHDLGKDHVVGSVRSGLRQRLVFFPQLGKLFARAVNPAKLQKAACTIRIARLVKVQQPLYFFDPILKDIRRTLGLGGLHSVKECRHISGQSGDALRCRDQKR